LSALSLLLNKQHNNINEFLFKTGSIPSVAEVSDVNVCLLFQSDVLSEELVAISYNFVAKLVAVGNYHLIIDVDSGVAESDEGEICKEYDFANIHFVQEKGAEMIVRTWERGVGWTSSCGSGAVACGYCYRKSLKIISSGGESSVQYDAGCVKLLTTPKITFSGIIRDLK
jgi:diaminopimelate epimerase